MKALIVDDDPDIREVVSLCFEVRWPGMTVLTAQDGSTGLKSFEREGADLVILDLGLPDMDGLDVCRKLREKSNVFIIMLTVRDQTGDIVRGLEAGADDYITKPFDQMELLARTNAVLRRGQQSAEPQMGVFSNGDLLIDFSKRDVRLKGDVVKLTPKEYNLLYQLATNPGKAMIHRTLLNKVWGPEYSDATGNLKVHIQHLRRKLKDNPSDARVIETEHGVGYKFIA
ncbi:MAG: response regulator transcription factor [SAR202 cluster bacterium]|nr:response regulator transcription factor [SAR202 cluster bacterium]